ncbi:hypothetical protein, partial [Sinomonas sp. ASV322]|uniref:hypothetical protein n=1 Tax=Sinomonas sp. ASV322 TaxID=3041920 RepID=UPI0027DC722C
NVKQKKTRATAEKRGPAIRSQPKKTIPTHGGASGQQQSAIKKNGIDRTWHTIEFSNNKPPEYISGPIGRLSPRWNEVQPYRNRHPAANQHFRRLGHSCDIRHPKISSPGRAHGPARRICRSDF